MLFNSWQFFIFFLAVFVLYFSLPKKFRWIVLLCASYFFYMFWEIKLVFLLIVCTLVNYLSALGINYIDDNSSKIKFSNRKRIFLLVFSLIISVGLLVFYKYINFISESLNLAFTLFSIPINIPNLKLLVPIGISFYTLQGIGYVIDVYKKKIKAERHLGYFALFVSFFPVILSGPIERAKNMLPQFRETHNFNYVDATHGLKIMLWGFFKKLVIADSLAVYVSMVYGDVHTYSGFSLIIATVFFAIQLYCDFSGYSDMARGCAKVLGFDVMDNFKSPYFSGNIRGFWRRWHISLSSWFQDYVYISLGGNRVNKLRWIFNIFIVFIISGIWHGGAWTFIAWGLLHGIYSVFGGLTQKARLNIYGKLRVSQSSYILKAFQILITFSLVCIAWVFFRAGGMSDAIYILSHAFDGAGNTWEYLKTGYYALKITKWQYLVLLMPVVLLFFYDLYHRKHDVVKIISAKPLVLRWSIYVLLFIVTIILMPKNAVSEFIYLKF